MPWTRSAAGPVCLAALILSLAAPAAVADTALLIGNSRHDGGPSIRDARALPRLSDEFEEAGFDVISGLDRTGADMQALLSEFLDAEEDEVLVIALAGHFARSEGGQSWFLGRDGVGADLATVGARGLSLATVMEVAASAPGRAVVLLGVDGRETRMGRGLAPGLGEIEVPQGVTVLTGEPDDVAEFAEDRLLDRGRSLPEMLERARGITAAGFLAPGIDFRAPEEPEDVARADPEERALWEAAQEIGTAGAYRAYLDAYPNGPAAAAARDRLEELTALDTNPEAIEQALGLTRSERRTIQADLTVLDFSTRGVDGIFGGGTRAAIRGWQAENGYEVTGYLDRVQIARIAAMADRRRAEIEEAERREAAAREEADRAYWQAIGQGRDEAGLRSYLDRYPDGLYADVARTRLEEYEAAAQAEREGRDRAAWARAEERDSESAYRDYLRDWPEGLFAETARRRLGIASDSTGDNAELAAREAALNIPPVMRQLIERRLQDMGYGDLVPDGVFDRDTRRAIAAYQQDGNLESTGYLDDRTMSRLLADAVRVIVR